MKRISFFVIIIILLFIILHLTTSIYNLWHKQDLLTNAQQQLQEEQKENLQLQKQLTIVKSPQFIDEEARNKLLLVKPGESNVLIDTRLLGNNGPLSQKDSAKPYWQQWLDLFFNF